MIAPGDVIKIHNILIDKFGGIKGIRDSGALEAALSRPYVTFDAKELYLAVTDKASAVFESLIINHPFIDGNKRIAYVLMRLILLEGGLDITASESEKYNFVISVTTGELRIDGIKDWLEKNCTQKK